MPNQFSRYTESQLRLLLSVLGLGDKANPDEVSARLERLRRGLEPEDEFILLLSWLRGSNAVSSLACYAGDRATFLRSSRSDMETR
jgi:hypothetical protein